MQFKEVRVLETGDTKGVAEKEAELLAKHEAAQTQADAASQAEPQIEIDPSIGFISFAIKLDACNSINIPTSCGALKSWLKFIGGALVQTIE